LSSKAYVLSRIDVFEKFRQPLSSALTEELDLKTQNNSETLRISNNGQIKTMMLLRIFFMLTRMHEH